MTAATRFIANEIAPGQETLAASEVEKIRARCAAEVQAGIERMVQAFPPERPARVALGRDPSVYLGYAGLALGLLHLFERGGDRSELELASRYLGIARDTLARGSFPPPEVWLSFHGTGGHAAIAAVVSDRLGDAEARSAELAAYRRLATAAADPRYGSDDLLWGRGGFLFGAAFLRERLGDAALTDDALRGVLEAVIETGRRHARARSDLTPGPHGCSPLLYFNMNRSVTRWILWGVIGARFPWPRMPSAVASRVVWEFGAWRLGARHRYEATLVHGLAGVLYGLLRFPRLLEARADWAADVRASLDALSDCVDRELGIRELLPSPRSDRLHERLGTPVYTDRVHWCNGTTGAVFLFARAFEVFGDQAYLDAARRAAEHVWRYGLLRKGNGLCHGIAGNGYAFLTLYRSTADRRDLDRALHFARLTWSERVREAQARADPEWSLYEGLIGTLCFYRDCLDPERARFPAFEV